MFNIAGEGKKSVSKSLGSVLGDCLEILQVISMVLYAWISMGKKGIGHGKGYPGSDFLSADR